MRASAAVLSLVVATACSHPGGIDTGPVPSGVTVDAQIVYYDVNAMSLGEMRQALASAGPQAQGRRWAAITTWRLSWTYRVAGTATECEIREPQVRVATSITFPRWSPAGQPDTTLAAWWDQLNAGLSQHEKGHARLAVAAGGRIVKALDGMSGGPCDALRTRADDAARALSREMQLAQQNYDVTTRHGQVQILQATRLQTP